MDFQPVPNSAKLEAIYSWNGATCVNVHYYHNESPFNSNTLFDLCEAYFNWFDDYGKLLCSNEANLMSIRATDVHVEDGEGIDYSSGLPIAGNNVTNSVPNNVAACISWHTPYRGRSFRGRTYHIGMPSAKVLGSLIIAGHVTELKDTYQLLMTLSGSYGTYNKVIVSYFNNGTRRAAGLPTDVTSVSVNNVVDSQRRRLPGRGA